MQKQVHRKCPICGRIEGEVLFTQHYGVPDDCKLPTHCDLVCCTECGFIHSDTPLTQEDYDRFYEEMSKYEEPGMASGGEQQPGIGNGLIVLPANWFTTLIMIRVC